MGWVLVGVALVTVFVFSYIDDWSRDLTTNHARTDAASEDLRPARIELPIGPAADRVRRAATSLRGWELAEPEPLRLDDGSEEWHFVRTTPLMRFKDDIHARLEPSADGQSVTVHLRSRSRIGKGDLGQNPRNLRELLRQIDRESQAARPAESEVDSAGG